MSKKKLSKTSPRDTFIRRKILWGVCKYLRKISRRVDERHHHPHHIQKRKIKTFSPLLSQMTATAAMWTTSHHKFFMKQKVCVKKLISLCSKLKDNIIKGGKNFLMLAVNFISHINSKIVSLQVACHMTCSA